MDDKETNGTIHVGRLVIDCFSKSPQGPGDYLYERGVIKAIMSLYRVVTDRRGSDLFKALEEGGREGQSGASFKWYFKTNTDLDSKE